MSFFGASPPEESRGEKYHKQPDPNANQSDLPLNEDEAQFVATPENTGKTTKDIKATAQPSSYWDMTTSVGNYMLSFVVSPTPNSNNEAPQPPAMKTLPSTLLPLELKDGTKLESSTVQLAYRCFYKEKPMQELQDQLPSSVARRETRANPDQQGKLIDPEDTTPLIVQKGGVQEPYEEIWGLDSDHHFIHVTTSEVRGEDLVETIQKHELAIAFQGSDVPNHLKERFYQRAISSEHLQEIQNYGPVMDRDAFQENLNATLRTMAMVERLTGKPLSDQMFEECFFALLDPKLRIAFENSVHQLDQIYIKNGAKLHKAGVLDDWYAGKEFREIATNDRIFKVMGIVGSLGLATLTGHSAIIGTYKPSKTLLLGLQILIFGPDLVKDLRKDVLNPKAVA
jgi:hypothetical protein